jgi:hypothetical protein
MRSPSSPAGGFAFAIVGLVGLLIAITFHLLGPLSWTFRFGFRFDSGKAATQTIWNILTVTFDLVAGYLWFRWDLGGSWRALAAAWVLPWVGWALALAIAIGVTSLVVRP